MLRYAAGWPRTSRPRRCRPWTHPRGSNDTVGAPRGRLVGPGVAYGGRGAGLVEWLIFEEEYYRSGAPGRVNTNGISLLGPTLFAYGTDAQKDRFLPPKASDALDRACRVALQCHGAIGYTIEYDLQLWLKRGWALAASWGDSRLHRRRIAAGLGLSAGRSA